MTRRQHAAVPPGGDDELPYVSLPICYTQPGRLAAMGALHGLMPPAPETARVLELGCASAGNLIPLAARFPQATFDGIDLSQPQIARGRRRIAQLGLSNIVLSACDLMEFETRGRSFDYIICHGVFSWVPSQVQDAILRIITDCLTPSGIAVLSYNVLPGWHSRSAVRDICLKAAGETARPRDRVARAREALEEACSAADDSPSVRAIRAEAERLRTQPSSYILGEYLAACNTPFYFRDVAERAARAGLAYLCEADLPTTRACTKRPQEGPTAKPVPSLLDLNERSDITSGRTFRRSLFGRAAGAPPQFKASQAVLKSLHYASPVCAAPERDAANRYAFVDHKGAGFSTDSAAVRDAFLRLAQVYPSTMRGDDLAGTGAEARVILKGLLALVAQGRATISATPLQAGSGKIATPSLWSVARAELGDGLPWVSTRRHTAVIIPDGLRALAHELAGLDHVHRPSSEGAVPSDRARFPKPDMGAFVEFARRNALLD